MNDGYIAAHGCELALNVRKALVVLALMFFNTIGGAAKLAQVVKYQIVKLPGHKEHFTIKD